MFDENGSGRFKGSSQAPTIIQTLDTRDPTELRFESGKKYTFQWEVVEIVPQVHCDPGRTAASYADTHTNLLSKSVYAPNCD